MEGTLWTRLLFALWIGAAPTLASDFGPVGSPQSVEAQPDRGATWQLGENFARSFFGPSTIIHAGAVGATLGLIESNVDATARSQAMLDGFLTTALEIKNFSGVASHG